MSALASKNVSLPTSPDLIFLGIKEYATAKESGGKAYTTYRLCVRCGGATPESWGVWRRFSDFEAVHKKLKALKCRVPTLPSKNPFGFQDANFLQSRERDLESWMKQVAELPQAGASGIDPMKTDEVFAFLVQGADEPPAGLQKLRASSVGRASGFGRWQNKVTERLSTAAGASADDEEDDDELQGGKRVNSTALPVGFAVDLEEELAKAAANGTLSKDKPDDVDDFGDNDDDYGADAHSPQCSPPATPGLEAAETGSSSSLPEGGEGSPSSGRLSVVDDPKAQTLAKTANTSMDGSPQKRSVALEDFEVLRVIGKGSFGKVFLVQKRNAAEDGVFAMKVLKKDHVKRRRQIEHTRTERKVLGTVRHPFIVSMHYAFQSDTKLYFVLDYCPGGELFFWLSREKRLPEHMSRFYTSEIALALGHLHDLQVVYRDLKPENILLDKDGHVKLADFGLAKEGVDGAISGAFSLCGTPEYLAPEILLKKGHGLASDWWNLGMVLYEMLTGLPPWYTTDRQQLFEDLKSAPLTFPDHVSPIAQDFISALLVRDPASRLGGGGGMQDVINHSFFTGIDWKLLHDKRYQPPFQPCRDQDIVSADNFEAEFRDLKVTPSEDLIGLGDASEPPIETRQHRLASDTFAGFSFQPEGALSSRGL